MGVLALYRLGSDLGLVSFLFLLFWSLQERVIAEIRHDKRRKFLITTKSLFYLYLIFITLSYLLFLH